jgi:hypothetical protein
MALNPTAPTFSLTTLQSIYSAFNNNLDYASTKYIDSNGVQQTITLVSFLGNPNFSGFNFNPLAIQYIYAGLADSLNKFVSDVSNNSVPNYNLGIIPKFRILITIADGTVFYDSYKGITNNSYDKFLAKSINENHATRVYIQKSFHSKDGIGYDAKWSSSTRAVDTYYSVRLGTTSAAVVGVIAFSYSNSF